MSYLFDTNIFLRLAEKNSFERQTVLNALRKLRAKNEIVCYTPQVLAEFWNVYTRPQTARGGLGLKQTERKANLIQKYFQLLPENLNTFNEWRKLVLDYKISGVSVHDAKLAASMIAHNVQFLMTFNVKDFQRFPMVEVIHPKDI
ncbi:MAG TPA: type II toxin-antitoxin system VapC family toxin [Pyrinomonadaceae bacterium]|jgi:predicted nucleic acid-binding protein